jgi:hypothetical protein
MVAQLDCNNDFNVVKDAAEKIFEINHWPYMHESTEDEKSVTFCIKKLSKNYLPNILATGAM